MILDEAQRDAVLNKGHEWFFKKALDWLITFLRLIRRLVFQLLLFCLDSSYDLFRYIKYSNSFFHSVHDRHKLEPLLFFYYHKIEKSLALADVKPLFGLGYMNILLDLMDQWITLTNDDGAAVFRGAYAALTRYRSHVSDLLSQNRPDLAQRIDKLLADYQQGTEEGTSCLGGTITITREELRPAFNIIDYDRFVQQRHSVRDFTDQHIPDDEIYQVVKLAQRSPSACNRQCWRVHVFTSAADKAKVLQCQNGNDGFGHLADRILLVTADLRAFISPGERHQAYTDTGMFAMSLLYALQAKEIASCCLNLSHSLFQEITLRHTCEIPEAETPVVMIAIGYPPESFKVAISTRVPTENILDFRN